MVKCVSRISFSYLVRTNFQVYAYSSGLLLYVTCYACLSGALFIQQDSVRNIDASMAFCRKPLGQMYLFIECYFLGKQIFGRIFVGKKL